jgi:hypothetical protein
MDYSNKTLENKQSAQSKRIVFCDFPWLWAIRNSWNFHSTETEFNVQNAITEEKLTGSLESNFSMEKFREGTEFWVYGWTHTLYSAPNKPINYQVKKIILDSELLREAILGVLKDNFTIECFVVVSKYDSSSPLHVSIHRAKKSEAKKFSKLIRKFCVSLMFSEF